MAISHYDHDEAMRVSDMRRIGDEHSLMPLRMASVESIWSNDSFLFWHCVFVLTPTYLNWDLGNHAVSEWNVQRLTNLHPYSPIKRHSLVEIRQRSVILILLYLLLLQVLDILGQGILADYLNRGNEPSNSHFLSILWPYKLQLLSNGQVVNLRGLQCERREI